MDARKHRHVPARFINDLRGESNIVFDKRPKLLNAGVFTIRALEAGEELFADYGEQYWRGVDMAVAEE